MPARPLIICFGDSLTAGYQSPTPAWPQIRETPYGEFLQERLGTAASVAVSGICGELTGEMVERFDRDVVAPAPVRVIILGGTNDLGWQAAAVEILENLASMYDRALAAGIGPVAVTVPSIRIEGDLGTGEGRHWLDDHLQRRHELNGMIRRASAERGIPCVDLFTATAEAHGGLLAGPFSNDGLHLTTDGYRCLADLLYRDVFSRPDWAGGADR